MPARYDVLNLTDLLEDEEEQAVIVRTRGRRIVLRPGERETGISSIDNKEELRDFCRVALSGETVFDPRNEEEVDEESPEEVDDEDRSQVEAEIERARQEAEEDVEVEEAEEENAEDDSEEDEEENVEEDGETEEDSSDEQEETEETDESEEATEQDAESSDEEVEEVEESTEEDESEEEVDEGYDREFLESLPYRGDSDSDDEDSLQDLAQKHDISARQSKDELIEQLSEV